MTGTPTGAAAGIRPRLRPRWMVLLPTAGALAVLAVLAGAAFAAGRPNDARWTLVGLYAGMWAAFAVAVLLLRRAGDGGAVALVMAGGIALQAVALTAPPRSTDDYYRYA